MSIGVLMFTFGDCFLGKSWAGWPPWFWRLCGFVPLGLLDGGFLCLRLWVTNELIVICVSMRKLRIHA